MTKVISTLLGIISIIFLAWIFISLIEINCGNLESNSVYSDYNFWIMFINFAK